jgi:hypothetical protein
MDESRREQGRDDSDAVGQQTKRPTNSPLTWSAPATAGAIAGSENAASEAISGQTGITAPYAGASSTNTTCSRRGPCAPSSSVCSISAERDGPVTNMTVRGIAPSSLRNRSQASS